MQEFLKLKIKLIKRGIYRSPLNTKKILNCNTENNSLCNLVAMMEQAESRSQIYLNYAEAKPIFALRVQSYKKNPKPPNKSNKRRHYLNAQCRDARLVRPIDRKVEKQHIKQQFTSAKSVYPTHQIYPILRNSEAIRPSRISRNNKKKQTPRASVNFLISQIYNEINIISHTISLQFFINSVEILKQSPAGTI